MDFTKIFINVKSLLLSAHVERFIVSYAGFFCRSLLLIFFYQDYQVKITKNATNKAKVFDRPGVAGVQGMKEGPALVASLGYLNGAHIWLYSKVKHSTLHCCTAKISEVQYSILLYSKVKYNTVQYIATLYST